MRSTELCALGAATMPSRDLVRILLRRPASDDELDELLRALALVGPAREAALRHHRAGPQLLAAVELGRRAWMLPSPAGRRVQNPVDVVTIVAPRATHDEPGTCWLLALDVRLTLSRLERTCTADRGALLRGTLAAGASRLVVASRRRTPAVPCSTDAAEATALARAADLVGVDLLDHVLLGEDGFCSLARLGLLPRNPREPRYR